MLLTKLFMRRLMYAPWLLAAGLVLGGAGEAGAQQVSVANANGEEGNPVLFTVTLSPASSQTVTVEYDTGTGTNTGGDATASTNGVNVDFTTTRGTLTFAPNERVKTVNVPTTEDSEHEGDETFTLTLSNPSAGVTLTDATATGTIIDDDVAPSLSVKDASGEEGNAVLFTVTLSAASSQEVTVTYDTDIDTDAGDTATSGTDFTATSGTLTFAPNETSKTVSVPISHDTLDEADETFTLTLSNPSNATLLEDRDKATGTITDNDGSPSLSVANAGGVEANAVLFTVTLSQESGQEVTVAYETTLEASDTAGSDDFTATSGTLTFAPNETSKTVSVRTIHDTLGEVNETFTLTLSNPSNATLLNATAMGTIEDNDPPSLSVADASGVEGNAVLFTVTLSPASVQVVTVAYETSLRSSDTAGSDDFTQMSGTLTIAAGATSGVVSVPTTDDSVDEPNETFTLTLSNPSADVTLIDAMATGTIEDDDIPLSLSVANAISAEGNQVFFAVTLSRVSGQEVTVAYVTSPNMATSSADGVGADFTAMSGTLTIAAGATSSVVSVPTTDDSVDEPNETFTLTLSNPSADVTLTVAMATGTIIDNDGSPSLSVVDASGVEGNAVLFTVTLSPASVQEVTVAYETTLEASDTAAPDDFTQMSGTLTIAAGAMSGAVSVPTTDDSVDEPNETFTLRLSNPPAGVTLTDPTATGTIEDDDGSLSVADASGVEGNAVLFTVTLSPASVQEVTVAYETTLEASDTAGSDDFTAMSGTLTIAAGATSGVVSVPTTDDSVDEPNETFTLRLSNPPAGVTLTDPTATGTIKDDDVPLSLSVANAINVEGNAVFFAVTLSPASGQEVTVAYETTLEASDTAGSDDFTAMSGTLTIAAGATSGVVSVPTTDDSVDEPNETFTLRLSNPPADVTLTDAMATGTIIDNDGSPSLSVADASGVEGNAVLFAVTLSPASGQEVTVAYETTLEASDTAGSDDFTQMSGTLTIAAGAMSGAVSVPTTDDSVDEPNETFTLRLSNPSAGVTLTDAMATGTIEDDDGPPSDGAGPPSDGAITLTVNPSSVREDAGATNITVRAKTPATVAADTYVALGLASESVAEFNKRFRITLPTLRIPQGQTEAEGTIIFTPIDDAVENNDFPITITGSAGAGSVGSTTIELVDDDKPSTEINLSFSDASISKSDAATYIVVTATLNGKQQRKDLSFPLVIDEVATLAGGLARDVDYSATPATITIPDRRLSGSATIIITPKNKGAGSVWVAAGGDPLTNDDGQTITVNSNFVAITDVPATAATRLTATPFSIREDAGSKEVTLEITLQNAVSTDETVYFRIEGSSDDLEGEEYEGSVDAQRDTEYAANPPSIVIPKGATKGMATMTVTPVNNEDENELRVFRVVAKIGGEVLASTGILITDDDSTSEEITLTARPDVINEGAGPTEVTVTGTLQGKVFGDDVVVLLTIDAGVKGAATRDFDYTTVVPRLVIPGGSTQGTMKLTITPTDNDGEEGNETIRLVGLESQKPRAEDEFGDVKELTVGYVDITLKDSGEEEEEEEDQVAPQDPTRPTFTADDAVADQEYAVGTAIEPLVLPEPTGGDAPITYSVSTLPAGLVFDAATRTISGTPTAVTDGAVNIVYTVIDNDRDVSALIFAITVTEGGLPPSVADVRLLVTPAAIREDAGTTQVWLTVTLAAARATAEAVTFTIVAPSEGTQAVRDVDYSASLGAIVSIPADATVGTGTLTLTPINNTRVDGLRAIGVQATFGSGEVLMTNVKITDDETPSTSISLSVSQHAIGEDSAETNITVTATLDGRPLAENASVIVAIDGASTATRDVDYAALFNPVIVIPAGSIMGSTQFAIRPMSDTEAEGHETIKLIGAVAGLAGDEVEITISDQAAMTDEPDEPDEPDDSSLAFADNTVIPNQTYTSGTAITPLVLPEASGGTAPLTYNVSALPAGLVFDAATRTLSGTPTAATDGVIVIYTVIDSQGSVAALTFSITVNEGLTFGDFFDFFGSSKVVPTASHDLAEIREFIVGQRVEGIVLPEASGGTAPLTYSLSPALPAGLMFDVATRTIAGTPRAEAETVYTYTVTDANGASASLSLQTLPTAFALADNFPNPFNPATTIKYALPQAADVELTVYNVLGQPVRTLVAEHQSAGRYAVEWDATDDSGHSLSSGIYFYRLQAGGEFREVKKMLLIK